MDPTTRLREEAAVCDFVALLLEDRARGTIRPLGAYQDRFPGHRERIAREYDDILAGLKVPGAAAEPPDTPRDIGPYRRLERLGHGGQGVVFRAEHRELRRQVALKMLHGGMLGLSSAHVARLRREAMALARLDDPAICAVYEVQLEGPEPYLAMRYVEGTSIAALIELARETGDGLPPTRREQVDDWLAFFEHAARALHAAHQAGIVHRDVKPHNLMRTPGGDPVLLDFGLARDLGSVSAAVTRPHELFGTLPYLAPELIDGTAEPDPRADVYALGVSLYETLTLQRPFAAVTPTALRQQILGGQPGAAREHNAHLSRDVDLVLATALELDPARRYASAAAFADDLRRARQREPVLARPITPWTRVWRWARRHPVASTALALVLVGLLTVLMLLAQLTRGQRELRALRLAHQAQSLAEQIPGEALSLAVEAAHIARHPEIDDVLLQVLDACHEERTIQMPQTGAGALDAPSGGFAVDPRQRTVAVPLLGGRIPVFRLEDGSLARTVGNHGTGRCFAAYTAAVDALLTAGKDGVVREWRAGASRPTAIWTLHRGDAAAESVSVLTTFAEGRRAVIGGVQGSVLLLDLQDRNATVRCDGHTGAVTHARLDPAERRLLTISADLATEMIGDATMRIFSTTTGELLATFGPYPEPPRHASWSPDGTRFAVALADGTVELRGASDGALQATFHHHGEVNCVEFDPLRPRLCTGSIDGFVVRDLTSGEVVAAHSDFADRSVTAIAYDPGATRVAIAARDGTARVYAADTLELRKILRAGPSRPGALAWTGDGTRVLTLDGRLHVWFAERRPFLPTMRGHTDRVLSAHFDATGERVISASRDGSARVWDAGNGAQLAVLDHGSALRGARFADGGAGLLTVGEASPVRSWRATGGAAVDLGPAVALDAWFDARGDAVICAGVDGVLRIHDAATGALRHEATLHDAPISCAVWHPHQPWLATGAADRTVHVYDCDRQTTVFRSTPWPWPHGPSGGRRVFGLAFSPDGRLLVASGEDLRLHAWSVPAGVPLWTGPQGATPGALGMAAGGRRIVVGAQWSPAVSLHDGANGHYLGPAPVVPDNMISSIAVAPGGGLALCADKHGRVALFEAEAPRLRSVFRASASPILAAEFSPDGHAVVTAAADGLVRVWPVDPLPVAASHRPSPQSQFAGR